MRKRGGAGDGGMEKYENLGLVGEGSYGMVLKCRHKETGQLVAIKKFLESEDDKMVKKIAMREVRMLKQLRHDHLVNLIEVFRRKKRLYLVFEFVDHTVLDELEKCPNGLDENTCRKILWQVLKGTEFCHLHHIIHRDIKPENILVSKGGIVKICDFGFARTLAQPGETYTDYVATRWYRAPELLVGDTKYGKAVDMWAVGCLLSEMLTGEPLFPGDSDIDQLYHIVKCFGNLTPRHREVFLRNPLFVGMRIPEVREIQPLERKFTKVSAEALDFMKQCLRLDPDNRPTCTELLKHNLFGRDGFGSRYPVELKHKLHRENLNNPLYKTPSSGADGSEMDNRDAEGTSKMAQAAAVKKKKKLDSKEPLSTSISKEGRKESLVAKDLSPKKENWRKSTSMIKIQTKEDVKKKPTPLNRSPLKTNDIVKSRVEKRVTVIRATSPQKGYQRKPTSLQTVVNPHHHQDRPKAPTSLQALYSPKSHNGSRPSPVTKHQRRKDEDNKTDKKKKVIVASTGSNGATASSTPVNENERERGSPNKKPSPPVTNGNTVSLPPAVTPVSKDLDEKEKEDKRSHHVTPSSSPQATTTTSIPPINQSGQTITPSSLQGSSPSIGSTSSHLAFSSFPHTMSPSTVPFAAHQYRVSPDKVLPKKNSSFVKKSSTSSQPGSLNMSPQPLLHSEKSSLHDKLSLGDKGKFKQQGGLSLPEVKGASEVASRSKKEMAPIKKSTVSSIPHIANIDPFSTNNSQADNYSDEEGLPTVT